MNKESDSRRQELEARRYHVRLRMSYGDRLSAEAYKQLSRLVMDKADELSEAGQITTDEWGAVEEENMSNLMLIDDVADL